MSHFLATGARTMSTRFEVRTRMTLLMNQHLIYLILNLNSFISSNKPIVWHPRLRGQSNAHSIAPAFSMRFQQNSSSILNLPLKHYEMRLLLQRISLLRCKSKHSNSNSFYSIYQRWFMKLNTSQEHNLSQISLNLFLVWSNRSKESNKSYPRARLQ